MKAVLLAAILFAPAVCLAQGGMAREDFAYSSPGVLSNATAGGTGFSTAPSGYYTNQVVNVSPTTVEIVSGSLNAPADIFPTTGNSIEIAGAEGAWRRFAAPLPLSNGETYYFSFLLNVANANTTSANNQSFLRLHKTGQSLGNTPYVGIRGTTAGLRLQGFLPGGAIRVGTVIPTAGVTYLVVGKIASNGEGGGELCASIFSETNPPPVAEPESWNLSSTSASISAVDLISSFGVAGTADSNFRFDEFRLGTTWRSAVPETVTLEPRTFYVAPAADGNGSGSSALNPAQYASTAFWNSVQVALARGQVTVVFLNGQYAASDSLILSNMGNPDHRLILQSQTQGGAVFNAGGRLQLNGCQNMTVRGFRFTGNDPDPSVLIYKLLITRALTPAIIPSKNLLIENNEFIDAPTYFGAVGLTYDNHHITFYNNTFNKIGFQSSGHMIYMAWGGHHIKVIGNYFGDTYGNRVRFRHNVDFGEVRLNTFVSTAAVHNLTFIPMYALNNQDPGNELHASNYLIRDNSFTYQNTGGIVNNRNVMGYHSQGFDPPGLHFLPTASDGNLLTNGTPAQKRQVMLNTMNIDLTKVRVFNNTYSGHNYIFRYSASAEYGATSRGWEGVANILNAVNTTLPGPGDLSGDGALTEEDIDLFLLAFEAENEMSFLLDNRVWFADYQAGDMTDSGHVGLEDVQPFIDLMTGHVPDEALDPLRELMAEGTDAPQVVRVASRMEHGGAGAFELDLPLEGTPKVEPRRNAEGSFTVVFVFDRPVTSALAVLTAAAGTVSNIECAGEEVRVRLSGVIDAQPLMVEVGDVQGEGSGPSGSASVIFKVLQGDVTGNGAVDGEDVEHVKGRLARTVEAENAYCDVNVSGTLNTGDVLTTKSRSGNSLP